MDFAGAPHSLPPREDSSTSVAVTAEDESQQPRQPQQDPALFSHAVADTAAAANAFNPSAQTFVPPAFNPAMPADEIAIANTNPALQQRLNNPFLPGNSRQRGARARIDPDGPSAKMPRLHRPPVAPERGMPRLPTGSIDLQQRGPFPVLTGPHRTVFGPEDVAIDPHRPIQHYRDMRPAVVGPPRWRTPGYYEDIARQPSKMQHGAVSRPAAAADPVERTQVEIEALLGLGHGFVGAQESTDRLMRLAVAQRQRLQEIEARDRRRQAELEDAQLLTLQEAQQLRVQQQVQMQRQQQQQQQRARMQAAAAAAAAANGSRASRTQWQPFDWQQ